MSCGSSIITFDAIDGVTQHNVLYVIEQQLTQQLWLQSSEDYSGKGLERRESYFGQVGEAHHDFLIEGRNEEARDLEYLVLDKSWPGHQILTAVGEGAGTGLCERFGLEVETPLHRHHTCKANKEIQHKNVTKTEYLVERAAEAYSTNQSCCLWFRGTMPGKVLGDPQGWVDEDACKPVNVRDFNKILHKAKRSRRRWRRRR